MSHRKLKNSLELLRGMAPRDVKYRMRGLTVSQANAIMWAIHALERVSQNECCNTNKPILYCRCEDCMEGEAYALQYWRGGVKK